jgi:hypothetical protein
MEAKIENGTLMIEYYRKAGVPVFQRAVGGFWIDDEFNALVRIVGALQDKVAKLELALAKNGE